MAEATLLASAVVTLATALGFAFVGRLMLQAKQDQRDRSAIVLYSLFWASAAIVWATQGITNLLAYLGYADLAIVSALDQVGTPFYCLAAAGLLYYVTYLVTGSPRALLPILLYYLTLFFLVRWQVESAKRLDIEVGRWVVNFVYETPLQGPAYTLIVALIALPILASVAVYASFLRRIHEPAARYRVALVSIGLGAWILTEALSFTSGFSRTDAGELTRRLVALASTLLLMMAYQPPTFARSRWGARPI